MSRLTKRSPAPRSSPTRAVMSSPDTDATRTVDTLATGELPHRVGQALGVETARVGDDGDAALDARREHVLELAQERAGVAAAALVGSCGGCTWSARPASRPSARRSGRRRPSRGPPRAGRRRSRCSWRCADVAPAGRCSRRLHLDQQVAHVDLLPGCARGLRHRPRPVARRVCSIFIASSTTSPSPSATTSPTRHQHLGHGAGQRGPALPGHARPLVGVVLGAQGEGRLALGSVDERAVRGQRRTR